MWQLIACCLDAVQGLWAGQGVAIKRVTIRTSADLDSFRQEVSLMAAAAHPHIVPLLAARALPPGQPAQCAISCRPASATMGPVHSALRLCTVAAVAGALTVH